MTVTKPQNAYRRAGDYSVMQGRDCALTYPRSCAHEGVSLVSVVECSSECPLSIEAKSPQPTAHTQLHKTRNKSQISITPKTSAISRSDLVLGPFLTGNPFGQKVHFFLKYAPDTCPLSLSARFNDTLHQLVAPVCWQLWTRSAVPFGRPTITL